MSLFTKLIKKSIAEFWRTRKKWLITLTVILGLLIGANLILNHYIDKVVGSVIKEFVHEKSKGFYNVEFDEIAYILNSGSFYMSNFKFDIHPDLQETITYEELTQQYLYGATIPELYIEIIDFWSIFVSRKLRVIGVEISKPYIRVINLNKNKKPKKISFEAGNLYEVLSGNLNELKINDFLIRDGEFDYETYDGPDYDNFQIKGLTFEVNNFQVNEESTTRKDKIFYTDDIYLEIKDQLFLLKDSIHKVTFDRFYISTSDNEFGFENFNLTRRNDTGERSQLHDHYEISLPQLRLAGIDFLKAYNNNLLMIDSLKIHDPTINIKKRIVSQKKDSSRHSLLDVAMVYHEYLMIEHFNLDDAHLIYTDETTELPKQYSIDHITAQITKVEIDTGRNPKYQYGFNFDEVDLVVKDYQVNLPDSINTVKFGEFSISSDPFEIKLKDFTFNPNPASNLAYEKNRVFASIPYLVITDFDIAQAINMDTFRIEELYIENPEFKIIPPAKGSEKQSEFHPGGLFGIYESIQSISDYFSLEKAKLINGKFQLESAPNQSQTNLSLNNINLTMENLVVDSLTNTQNDLLGELLIDLSLQNSTIQLPAGQAKIKDFSYNSGPGRVKLDSISILSDTVNLEQKTRISIPEILLTGFNPNDILFDNELILDTLKFRDVNIFTDLPGELAAKSSEESSANDNLPTIKISHLLCLDYDIDIREEGYPLFLADNIKFDVSGLKIDQSISDNPLNQFDYDKIHVFSMDDYDLFLRKQNHIFEAEHISWIDEASIFSMENISLKPYGKTNNRYDIEVPKITMNGIKLKKMLKESYYDGDEIFIEDPKIKLKLAKGQQENPASLDLGFIPVLLRNRYHGVKANTFAITNAEIVVHQDAENDSLIIETDRLNLLVDNFEVDSTTVMVPDRFLFANDVRLDGEYFSIHHKANNDFYHINHYFVSTKEADIRLNGIYHVANTKNDISDKANMKINIDNLNLWDFDFFDLTQNKALDIREIHIDNADIQYAKKIPTASADSKNDSIQQKLKKYHLEQNPDQPIPSETKVLEDISRMLSRKLKKEKPVSSGKKISQPHEYLLDTSLLKRVDIDRILITDSKIDLETTDDLNTGMSVPDIWFLAEGIHYNPAAIKDSNRLFYSDNIVAIISNFEYVLPDNLSAIRIDELAINSSDSSLKATNFALVPLVSRYDYGPAKGYQSTWLQIENDSITMKHVDYLGILNHNTLNAQSLNVHKLDISIFRDKRIAFPEWQRRPLPQTSLQNINFPFGIDSLMLHDGFISYQEHSEKAYTTGEVFFSDLNALILNITNDSTRIGSNPSTRISATANIFDSGNIKVEFVFNLIDAENIHSYSVDVQPFDLTEFNRILIPSASVQIASGENKRIIMNAKANEDYSYGEMKFYYDDLKIQLLNRETETRKGIGNVLGSFFANTFIIKSNNPRNFILRKGDIFFERDKKRAIFNYWTKTFLSGVVSSLGAANNKKKIKKMQDENLKNIQAEKKETTSL